jgi:DNA-binding beta-propeller fold protein YncE
MHAMRRRATPARSVSLDEAGNVYIAEPGASAIRRIDMATGIITTAAGTGARSYEGDGGPAWEATLNVPSAILLLPNGNMVIADTGEGQVQSACRPGMSAAPHRA